MLSRCAERPYLPNGACFSYEEASANIERRIHAYREAGCAAGQRVGPPRDRPEFFWHYLALNALELWAVPLNPTAGRGMARAAPMRHPFWIQGGKYPTPC